MSTARRLSPVLRKLYYRRSIHVESSLPGRWTYRGDIVDGSAASPTQPGHSRAVKIQMQ